MTNNNLINRDMSLIGPRPLLMQYLSRYNPEQLRGTMLNLLFQDGLRLMAVMQLTGNKTLSMM